MIKIDLKSLASRIVFAFLVALLLASGRTEAQDSGEFRFEKAILLSGFICEGANAGDLDSDGHLDVIAGPYVFFGPTFERKRTLYEPRTFDPKEYSDSFFAWVEDLDSDHDLDVVMVGFPGKEASWFENPGKADSTFNRHLIHDGVDNESPAFEDLIPAKGRELICQFRGRFGYLQRGEDPKQPWTFHAISGPDLGGAFTHGLGVGDLDGDGRKDVLWKQGYWLQPEKTESPAPWAYHPFPFAERGGAQMLVDDVDQDGDSDVITSLDAHGFGLVWYEQTMTASGRTFQRHFLMGAPSGTGGENGEVGNLHALDLADLDSDGRLDIVTGNRYWAHGGRDPAEKGTAPVIWFRNRKDGGSATFEKHVIDADSGVGTQVVAIDVNADGRRDVVVGNKRGVFVHFQRPPSEDRAGARIEPVPAQKQQVVEEGVLPQGRDGKPLNLDFESGDLRDWVVSGRAFEGHPIRDDTVIARRADMRSRHQGRFWAGSYEPERSDATRGTLTSAVFRIDAPFASFLVGGGHHEKTCVEVVDAAKGTLIFRASGKDDEAMHRVVIDLQPHRGKDVFVRVVDDAVGHWGHVNFDDFRFFEARPPETARESPRTPGEQTEGFTAAEAAKRMTLPPNFHADVIASEPDLHQPIAFTIDEDGRIFVAEAYAYPTRQPEGQGRDRILVLEDRDQDGSYEKRTVFIENLNLVSGLEVGFGGVFVGAAPYLMFIPDRDRNLEPDGPPEILLDGFGYQDTHETLNAFNFGPDGWLYGCHGVFTHSRVGPSGTPEALRVPINAGVFRYHPVTKKFEVFAFGTSNPWGVDFDANGEAFITACVIPHLYHMSHGGRYERQAGSHFEPWVYDDLKTIADHRHYVGETPHGGNNISDSAGGGHAHCGALIYLGSSFPAEYRGRVFMNNVHGNRTLMDALKPRGSTFVGSHVGDFLVANDKWFRGISLRTGPDGNLYLIDWYDQQACHRTNPEIWDRKTGRFYRIRYGEQKPARAALSRLSGTELVEMIDHENEWHARTARRLLQERGVDRGLMDALEASIFEPGPLQRRLRALHFRHAIGGTEEALALRLFQHEEPYLRAWAARLVTERGVPSPLLHSALADLARKEESPVVLRFLISAAWYLGSTGRDAALLLDELLASAKIDDTDPVLPTLLWYAVATKTSDPDELERLAAVCKQESVTMAILRRLASVSGPKGLGSAVGAALRARGDPLLLRLRAIQEGLGGKKTVELPAEWAQLSQQMMEIQDPEVAEAIMDFQVLVKDPSVAAKLLERSRDTSAPIELRKKAIFGLERLGHPELGELCRELLKDAALRPLVIPLAVRTLGESAAADLIRSWGQFSAAEEELAAGALASRPEGALEFLSAVDSGQIPRRLLDSATLRRSLLKHSDARIATRLEALWGKARPMLASKEAEISAMTKRFSRERLATSDPSAGRALYIKTCGACHRLFGEGRDVGPDLTGSNRSDPAYLLGNMLDPSAEVAKEYQVTMVAMKDGQIFDGIVQKEDERSLTIALATETVIVKKEEIDRDADGSLAIRPASSSMMPDDQLAGWSDGDIANLLAYLGSTHQVPFRPLPEQVSRFFDGRSLTFWRADPSVFTVSEGEIVGRTKGLTSNAFAVSELLLRDFRLVVEVRLVGDQGNSGIQFRSEPLSDGEMRGYQADIGPGWWGRLYEESGRGLLEKVVRDDLVKKDGWNTYEILAIGPRVRMALNGTAIVDRSDHAAAQGGVIGLQVHSGGPTEVRFRNLRLEIDPTSRDLITTGR